MGRINEMELDLSAGEANIKQASRFNEFARAGIVTRYPAFIHSEHDHNRKFPALRAMQGGEGSGKILVDQAARRRLAFVLYRPSSTAARTVATQCAPQGDHRMRCFLAIRALAISSTQPSARDVEIGSLER